LFRRVRKSLQYPRAALSSMSLVCRKLLQSSSRSFGSLYFLRFSAVTGVTPFVDAGYRHVWNISLAGQLSLCGFLRENLYAKTDSKNIFFSSRSCAE